MTLPVARGADSSPSTTERRLWSADRLAATCSNGPAIGAPV